MELKDLLISFYPEAERGEVAVWYDPQGDQIFCLQHFAEEKEAPAYWEVRYADKGLNQTFIVSDLDEFPLIKRCAPIGWYQE